MGMLQRTGRLHIAAAACESPIRAQPQRQDAKSREMYQETCGWPKSHLRSAIRSGQFPTTLATGTCVVGAEFENERPCAYLSRSVPENRAHFQEDLEN